MSLLNNLMTNFSYNLEDQDPTEPFRSIEIDSFNDNGTWTADINTCLAALDVMGSSTIEEVKDAAITHAMKTIKNPFVKKLFMKAIQDTEADKGVDNTATV